MKIHQINEKSWIFTISKCVLGNLGVNLIHPPKLCARLRRAACGASGGWEKIKEMRVEPHALADVVVVLYELYLTYVLAFVFCHPRTLN